MEPTKWIWQNGQFLPWEQAKVHVLVHTLHYGAGVFEGLRAYKTPKGPAIYRLSEHTKRLRYSASAIQMEIPYSDEQINAAIVELVKRNQLEHGYIRPLVYYGYGVMGLNPKNAPVDIAIACWPWGAYLPHETVKLKISKYIRIHPRSTISDAKICGHYVNSILAVQQLKGTEFHEALFLDFEGNIAEGPGENIFLVKNNKLYTPKSGSILAGITRATAIEIAQSYGWEVIEKALTPEDAFAADEVKGFIVITSNNVSLHLLIYQQWR